MNKASCLLAVIACGSPQEVQEKVGVACTLTSTAHNFLCFKELQERDLKLTWWLGFGGLRLLRALAMGLVEPLDKVSSACAEEGHGYQG